MEQLVKEIDPEGDEKTLIFAATDEHADLVVKLMKEELKRLELMFMMMLFRKLQANHTTRLNRCGDIKMKNTQPLG
jgi:type I site-specific restriction endonuclease